MAKSPKGHSFGLSCADAQICVYNADIISISFGFPVENAIVQPAFVHAFPKGKVIFAATAIDGGNGGMTYPAKDPIVIGVNAADSIGK